MSPGPSAPGFMIAAPRSGAGKTTVTLGLMRAFRRRGLAVQPFKCGPDYIDPAFHARAAGRSSFNLDTWSMRASTLSHLVARAHGADLAIAEGVMGLFDGVVAAGQTARGSTADLAALTGWPVVLVIDVAGQAETAAAVALGLKMYRADVAVQGVILNRVSSARQERLMAAGFERIGLPVLGQLTRADDLALPERHLGLVQAGEIDDLDSVLDRLADRIEAGVDLDAVMRISRAATLAPVPGGVTLSPPGQRIALAQDSAFSFSYPHLIEGWREQGASILPFSPLVDECPDASADVVWLPGGYPELNAARLASAQRFLEGLRTMAGRGVLIHGECGGYMALGAGLIDREGHRHAMAGLLDLETSFAKRALHLGYRRARISAPSALGAEGQVVYGHEFHYATIVRVGGAPLVEAFDAEGKPVAEAGSRQGSVSGTFFHVIDGAAS